MSFFIGRAVVAAFTLIAFTGALNAATPTTGLQTESPAQQTKVTDGLPGSVSLDPTKRMISVELNSGTSYARRFLVQDGVMNSLTLETVDGAKEQFVFIAKLQPGTEKIVLHKVDVRKVLRDGKERPRLFVGEALSEESSSEDFARVGVASVKLTLADSQDVSRSRQKHWSNDDEFGQRRCCTYTPCPPYTRGIFCVYGSEGGCGGDGCGECCL